METETEARLEAVEEKVVEAADDGSVAADDTAAEGAEAISADGSEAEPAEADDARDGDAGEHAMPTGDAPSEIPEEAEPTGQDVPRTAPVRVEKKTSLAAMLISALLGGGVALAGAGFASKIPGAENIPGLGAFATGGNTGESAELQAANSRIDALQAKLDELAAQGGASGSGEPDPALVQRLDSLETSVNAIKDAGATAGSGDAGAAQAAAAEAAAKAEDALQRIAALEAAGGSGSGIAGNAEEMTALKDEIGKVTPEIQRLDSSISELSGRVQTVEDAVNTQILPAMESVKQAAETAERGQSVAKSVSARALATVLEQGGEFSGELAAAEALAGPSAASEALKPVAAEGLPTQAALLAEFQPLANLMIEGSTMPDADAGVVARFMASAKSLVKVRPAGPVAGDSVTAIVSRVEAALKAGDLGEADAQWLSLPESARAVSADWAAKLKMRIEAEKNIRELIAQLGGEG